LNYIAFNMNQVACSTVGFSPHQLVFGKNLRSEIGELRDRFLGLATNDCQRQRQVKKTSGNDESSFLISDCRSPLKCVLMRKSLSVEAIYRVLSCERPLRPQLLL